jgi:hypothetical protein
LGHLRIAIQEENLDIVKELVEVGKVIPTKKGYGKNLAIDLTGKPDITKYFKEKSHHTN